MKNYLLAGSLLLTLCVQAQKTKTKVKTTPKKTMVEAPVTSSPAGSFSSETDSLSYAIGMSVAEFWYRQQGLKDLNPAMISKAITDAMHNQKSALTEDQANLVLMCHSNPALCGAVRSGEQFLEKNRKNANVKTTASGLQYEVLRQGTGKRPGPTDSVTVNYMGTLINGTEFDNSYKRGQPITFQLNQVIRGWTEGLQLMSEGSKYKFYIPYQLGYGLNDAGGGAIPGGSVLVFEVELLSVKKG